MGTPNSKRSNPGVAYLSWPTGSSFDFDVSPEHPRVKWEVGQIYEHLVDMFGGDETAAKMDHLTAPTTSANTISKI